MLGLQDIAPTASRRIFLAGRHGGLGFQSTGLCRPAAYAPSWHTCLPSIMRRLQIAAVSALIGLSPWARACLPAASRTVQLALNDDTAQIGDENLAASGTYWLRPPSLRLHGT